MPRFFATFLLLMVTATAGLADDAESVVQTTGSGTVEATPDMATVSVGVTHQAGDAATALSATSDAVRAVLSTLEGAGIAARDLQTSGLSVQPVWSGRGGNGDAPPQITGFAARNVITARIRELDRLGAILDAVVQDGANTLDGVQFALQDPEPLMAEARAAAVRDAMMRAEQLAAAAGVKLGDVLSITDGGGAPRPQMMEMAAASRMSDVPIAAGELSLRAQVSMVFKIESD